MSSDLASLLVLSGYQGETKNLDWALRLKNAKAVFGFLGNLAPKQFVSPAELTAFRQVEMRSCRCLFSLLVLLDSSRVRAKQVCSRPRTTRTSI